LSLQAAFSYFRLSHNKCLTVCTPPNEKLLLHAHPKGNQIHACKADGEQFTWTLKAPEAQLFTKDGKPFGKHFAGPSWEANDSSRVTGKAAASVPSPTLTLSPG